MITPFHMSVNVERVVEQVVDTPVLQAVSLTVVVEMSVKVQKITQQVKNTEDKLQIVSRQDPAGNL